MCIKVKDYFLYELIYLLLKTKLLVISDGGKKLILTFEKLEPGSVWHFYL